MAEDSDKLRRLRIETATLEQWVAVGWITPEKPEYSDSTSPAPA